VYFNTFADGLEPLDLASSDEFASLLASARDLGTPAPASVRYRSRNTVLNGLRFHFLEWGDPSAPPMLLLHGGNQTAHSWDLVSLALSDRYHIIALDQRGHGDSEWPRDVVATRHDMASDAYALVQQLGLKDPIVAGHSMGGIVTMTLLTAHPDLASRAIIVDVGPELSPKGAQHIGNFVRSVDQVGSLDEFIDRVAAYDPFRSREHISRTVIYNVMRRLDGKLVSKHDHRGYGLVGEDGKPLQRVDRPTYEEVSTIPCPVLVLRGEQSNILAEDAAERFVSRLAHGKLVVVPKSGHNIHSQNTPFFIATVEAFLAGEPAGAAVG
jgi:pimeloyl-ACP methyl ester carboxylesterase